ncbi:MAG: DNA-binding protein [Clostridia bacterium]|nr:DNA-binding protein [Clostridia bacterium]
MERNRFKYCELKAYYGGLLTDKQSEIFTLHYEEDYSLAEIAEKFNITRQAVLDNIRKAEKVLDNAEQKIGLVARDNKIRKLMEELEQAIKSNDLNKATEIINTVKKTMEE